MSEDAENAAGDDVPSVAPNQVVAPPRTPAAEVGSVLEPEEEAEPTKFLEENKSHGSTGRVGDIGDDGASPRGGSPRESLVRAEDKASSDCAPLGCQGGGGDSADDCTDTAEKCKAGDYKVMQGGVLADQRSPGPTEVEPGGDGCEKNGSAAPNSRIDFGMEEGWFQKLEAKMGAIKKQVRVRNSIWVALCQFCFLYTYLMSASGKPLG